MIVGEDNRMGGGNDRGSEDFAWVDLNTVDQANGDQVMATNSSPGVESPSEKS